jgi:prepilin-type N-terminal cleavage/methylation domain-containing protein
VIGEHGAMRSEHGLSLLELLVVMAIVSLVGGTLLARPMDGGSAALSRDAEKLASALRTLRLVAVLDGRVVPVLGEGCEGAPLLRPSGVEASFPARGLAFSADGLPRPCASGGLGNLTITLRRGTAEAAVVVSSLGRVRWEVR